MHITDRPVAVLAGTPVDTQMGADVLAAHGISALNCPVSRHPLEQAAFQVKSRDEKHAVLTSIIRNAMDRGCGSAFIYCNSLSGAFDFEPYCKERGVRVYTPLQVYRSLGREHKRIGVVAANNLSAYNIEKNLMMTNDSIYVVGSGNMAMVHEIEANTPPAEIVEKLGLKDFLHYVEACGSECLVLGCTHFPYLKEELAKYSNIPLIDPADEMFDKMLSEAES